MGFTDIIERMGISYESEESYDLIDEIMEHVSYAAIDESADLARERGSYPNFEGSGWSQGMVPFDSIARTEADRGLEIKVNRTTRLDWDALRAKVKGGMRNATLMAIAPTASIGLVAGTTPGLDPQFSQIFSRATSNGKFLEVNRNLVVDLQKLGIWDSTKESILRSQGDIQNVAAIPDHLKEVYKTSFQLSPYSFLEVAARAQKWIDQAISRNMYLETRDLGDMMDIYFAAWERGVKTTYYLHMKPRHTAEQSTVKVNKSEDMAEKVTAPASAEAGTAGTTAGSASADSALGETPADPAAGETEPVDTAQARKAYQDTAADGEQQASGVSNEDRVSLEKLQSLLREVRQILEKAMDEVRNGKTGGDYTQAMPLPTGSSGIPSSIVI